MVDRGGERNVSFHVGNTKFGGDTFGCGVLVPDVGFLLVEVEVDGAGDSGRFMVSFFNVSELVIGAAGGPGFLGSRSLGDIDVRGLIEGVVAEVGEFGFEPGRMAIAFDAGGVVAFSESSTPIPGSSSSSSMFITSIPLELSGRSLSLFASVSHTPFILSAFDTKNDVHPDRSVEIEASIGFDAERGSAEDDDVSCDG